MTTDLTSIATRSPEEILTWAAGEFGARAALVTAFQAEGVVVLDIAHRAGVLPRVVTVDSGRLPDETYRLIDDVRVRYDVRVEVLFPNPRYVERMTTRYGVNLFLRDKTLRELCCHVRKVMPLDPILGTLDAWITGLRRGQSEVRAQTPKVQIDDAHGGIVKINPIADWTREQVWDYIRTNKVPFNPLYDQGYATIGCAPCTRAIKPGEHERAGRWWWESGENKECGIHARPADEQLREEIAWLLT